MTDNLRPRRRAEIVGLLVTAEVGCVAITIRLDDGKTLSASSVHPHPPETAHLIGQRIMADAFVLFDDSECPSRVEIESISAAPTANSFFSRLPKPPPSAELKRLRVPQDSATGMNAIFGRWPGDESDEEIAAALDELS